MKDTCESASENSRKSLPDLLLRAFRSRREERQRREFDRNKDSLARFRKEVANRNKLGQKDP